MILKKSSEITPVTYVLHNEILMQILFMKKFLLHTPRKANGYKCTV